MISLKLCDDGNPVILNADMNNTEKSAKASTKKVGSKAKRETKLKEKQIEKPRPIPPQVNQSRVLYKQFKVERTVRVRYCFVCLIVNFWPYMQLSLFL